MRKYDKEFKEEAVKLSDEVGVKQAATQLGARITLWLSGARSGRITGATRLWAAASVEMRRFRRTSGG